MVLAAVTNGFGYQYLVLVPLFARNVLHGDARAYGFLVAIQGLGSVIGAATLASRVTSTRHSKQSDRRAVPFRGRHRHLRAVAWLSLSLVAQLVIGAGLTNFRASNNTLVQLFVSMTCAAA